MDSKLGLIIQLNGVFLITILSIFLRRSLKLTALKYWTTAWLSLSFALICLRLAFEYQQLGSLLFTYYFLGQYVFGFMLVAGCRNLADDFELRSRSELAMIPFVMVAIALPLVSSDFDEINNFHSFLLSGLYAAAFIAIRKSPMRSFGSSIMHVALGLLTLNFLLYFLAFGARVFFTFDISFLGYNAIIDLVLQTSLGLGMVIVLLEKVLSDFQSANNELRTAHRRLEDLVNTDALTTAFNRHAFYGFVDRHASTGTSVGGCVGFFDVDDLKSVNDHYGHAVGDAAIRAVAGAIRDIVRAEDLIFRWGGDEFFVVMISMETEMAELRMSRLETSLRNVLIDGMDEPINIGVSWGFRDFSTAEGLEAAIQTADSAMYDQKQARKRLKRNHELAASRLQPRAVGL